HECIALLGPVVRLVALAGLAPVARPGIPARHAWLDAHAVGVDHGWPGVIADPRRGLVEPTFLREPTCRMLDVLLFPAAHRSSIDFRSRHHLCAGSNGSAFLSGSAWGSEPAKLSGSGLVRTCRSQSRKPTNSIASFSLPPSALGRTLTLMTF